MTDTTDRPRLVPIRSTPPLNDVPARLRLLADQVEAGQFDTVRTMLVVVERRQQGRPLLSTLCFGENPERPHVIGLLHMAAAQRTAYPDSDDDD